MTDEERIAATNEWLEEHKHRPVVLRNGSIGWDIGFGFGIYMLDPPAFGQAIEEIDEDKAVTLDQVPQGRWAMPVDYVTSFAQWVLVQTIPALTEFSEEDWGPPFEDHPLPPLPDGGL